MIQRIKKILFNKKIQDIFLIFLLSLTPLLWFRKNEIIVGHDNVFALNPITFLAGRLFAWVEHGFGQGQDLIMGTIPIHLIDAIPYMFGFSLQATEKIVYVFWFFMIGLSAYILARQFSGQSRIFGLLAVILYQFNFFLLQGWWIGERTKFSASIALPLILTVFLKVYRGEIGITRAVILNSLIFFVFNAGGLYGIPLYGGLFIAIAAFVIFFSIIEVFNKRFLLAKKLIFLTVFTVVGYFLVNSYFIFPAVARLTDEYRQGIERVGGVEGLLDWTKVISANASYINLFRLEGIAEWYDNLDHPYAAIFLKNPFFMLASFIWPVLIILSLTGKYNKDKQKIVLFFFLVFLIGIFLSSGTHRPFGMIYETLVKYIPGFAAFRSPYFKFAGAIFLAASFLIAFYIDTFQGKKKYVLFTFAVIFIFIYHFPYFTGNIFSWKKGFSTRLTMPSYVAEFGYWLEKEKKDESRVLFLPPNNPDWQYSAYDWGYLSFQALPTLLSNKSTVINNDRLNDNERKMVEALYNAFSDGDKKSIQQLSTYLGIKYFVVQEDVISGEVRSYLYFSQKAQTYKDAIEEKLKLPKVKRFGRWSLYALDKEPLPLFYTAEGMTVISGPVSDFSHYYDFLGEEGVLGKSVDFQLLQSTSSLVPDIYSPSCLRCKKKDRPLVDFPKRSILPDSPLYPLILFAEKQSIGSKESRNLVYDYLGLSLKRLAELREMISYDIRLAGETLNQYEANIRLIHTNFNKLRRLEDKYSAAEDLTYYIRAQRDFINEALGEQVIGPAAATLDHTLTSLKTLEQGIRPYVLTFDITQNRLFAVSIAHKNTYKLYIRSKEFESMARKDAKISVQIDGKQIKTLPVFDKSFQEKWFMLGDSVLDQGDHTIFLSFSELENKVSPPQADITVINSDERQQCFTTKVQNYNNSKRYKTIVRYRNDFLNDINIYIWEEREKEQRLRFASRLFKSPAEEEFTHEIDPDSDIKGIVLGFCSASLTEDFMRERFMIKVSELIEPVLVLFSDKKKQLPLGDVSYKKINPSRYSVSFSTTSPNSILVFNSRFDKGWELEKFDKNHAPISGFANGWLIDKSGRYSLALVYKPQNTVQLGGFLSFSTVIAGVLYLVRKRRIR